MKNKKRKSILASIAIFAMAAMAAPAMANDNDRESLPTSESPFWEIFAQMATPEDTATCQSVLADYIASHSEESGGPDGEMRSEMTQMCTQIATMYDQMASEMSQNRVSTNIFDETNWHSVDGLYFQKSGDSGAPMGRISFSETIDFMSYRFFSFMNNFNNMVKFDGGYISLNAAMVPDMINYGATLTMYQLGYDQQPDIYVSNGATMREAIEGRDVNGIVWDAEANTLAFIPGHFSSFKAVQQGTKASKMKISSVKKKSIRYREGKTFSLKVKGKSLYKKGSDLSCTLGFQQSERVKTDKRGKRLTCIFGMDSFSSLGTFPLTVSIEGQGEVTRTNAVRFR